MSKRHASSPLVEEAAAKKQKVTDSADTNADAGVEGNEGTPNKAAKKTKNPPVKDAFLPWKPTVEVPQNNQFWGIKPLPGCARPHPDQPSARGSNGATNPPMWEDRKYRFKRGSRYVKYFGPIEPEDADNLPESLDQEELLFIQLIDMRPKSSKDPTPKRTPTVYAYDGGKPKDWNSMQAVKCLNDRRAQAIDRITVDAPWTRVEREYLASLLQEFPDASIWELAERHNERFMNQDFAFSTGFSFAGLSDGRTVESVSYEYKTYKSVYDQGKAPESTRFKNDNSRGGKAIRASKAMETAFGPSSKALEKEWDEQNDSAAQEDEEHAGVENENENNANDVVKKSPKKKGANAAKKAAPKKTPTKKTPTKKGTTKRKSKAIIIEPDSDDDDEPRGEPVVPMAHQPALNELDEELLELAGAYDQNEIRHGPPHSLSPEIPTDSRQSRSRSPSPRTGEESPVDPEVAQGVEQIVGQIVDEAVAYAEQQNVVQKAHIEEVQQIVEEKVTVETTVKEITSEETTLVQPQSQTETTAVAQSLVSSTIEQRTSIHAARRVQLDENYDDGDEEL
ncbi:uncharacterized protein K460DRAFT_376544 [Cucurbitaria berberidis CBS 394.84]|uniref:Uncharacterized protein n=1 Tax=Cucurbitaria berberidis CBS 394.84 TaxID=1168544 RepID=A0A9P4L893_9PLEO|nr:uncharacterized protein K460DRAFT_376544 [Cucurbitaria berberidis CBS 394.84]KAF1845018.1 hypothetical protein K460DRAFT_376544 [Cucurbitaria berberidis CBS 394.84]